MSGVPSRHSPAAAGDGLGPANAGRALDRIARVATYARHAVAGMAIAVAVFLLLRVSLIATFRVALLVLAAIEIVAFSVPLMRGEARWRSWLEIAVKLAVLGGGYLALGQ